MADQDAEKADDHPRKGAGIAVGINPLYPLDADSYKFVEKIGSGVGSTVHKATCNTLPIDSSLVAIKVIDLQKSNPDFESEAKEMATTALPLHDDNILQPYCIFTVMNTTSLWVVMPFFSNGSLQSIVASFYPNGLPEEVIAAILKPIITTIKHLHNCGHLHRDIKAGNIFIDSTTGAVQLADFGVSANARSSSSSSSSSTGTPYWKTPEAEYGTKSDIWSIGITTLELAHGRSPLSPLCPFSRNKFSECFKNMVSLCLDRDPLKRATAENLLVHFFIINGRGADFLKKNMKLDGVPAKRNNRLKRKTNSSDEGDDDQNDGDEDLSSSSSGEIVTQMMTSGWKFNSEGFCLDPIFPDGGAEAAWAEVQAAMTKALIDMERIKIMKKDMLEVEQTVRQNIEALKSGDMNEPGRKEKLQMMLEVENHTKRWFQLAEIQIDYLNILL